MTLRWLFGTLAPGGPRARLTVFMFHRVQSSPDPLFPGEAHAEQFERQMRWVRQWFNVLSLTEAVQRLRAHSLPPCPAAITFDDGYADNYTVALPILRRLGLTATVFVATGYLDGGRMWNDVVIDSIRGTRRERLSIPALDEAALTVASVEEKRVAVDRLLRRLKYLPFDERNDLAARVRDAAAVELPGDIMLTTAQLRGLHQAGVTIAAHTVSHPILNRVEDTRACQEIEASREAIHALVGERPALFAYPNGKPGQDYSARHAMMVERAGFAAAFSTSSGAATDGSDLFQLPRFTPWERTAQRWAYRLAMNLRNTMPAVAAA